jgi:riboflavin synthase
MFTGLIDDVGTIERVATTDAGREFRVRCRYDDLSEGESIALNGACLTVLEAGPGWFSVAAVVTTLDRTTIGAWSVGRRVNLERAMRAVDRFGGHFVQGHVDGVGGVLRAEQHDDAWLIDVELPAPVAELVIPHGSIAVDGVSLTVNEMLEPGVIQLSIIDITLRRTTLGSLRPGDHVQLEGDMVGKYVHAMMRGSGFGNRESILAESRFPSPDSNVI